MTNKNPSVRTPAGASAPDLRRTLLAAVGDLLAESGLEAFSLREVARRAGVSHAAPAHHFGDARGLLTAWCADAFEQLAARMAKRRTRARGDAFARLVAAGLAYADFALEHRARFQLMFRSDRLDGTDTALRIAGDAAYAELDACIAALGDTAPPLRAERAALAWSLVHGYATLALDNAGFAARLPSRRAAHDQLARLLAACRPSFVAEAHPSTLPTLAAPTHPD